MIITIRDYLSCFIFLNTKWDAIIGNNLKREETIIQGSKMAIDRVQGDLILEDGSIESISPDNIIQVMGSVKCRGDCKIEGNLRTLNLESHRGDIEVKGDLKIESGILVKRENSP